jgi:hypothetical protein
MEERKGRMLLNSSASLSKVSWLIQLVSVPAQQNVDRPTSVFLNRLAMIAFRAASFLECYQTSPQYFYPVLRENAAGIRVK